MRIGLVYKRFPFFDLFDIIGFLGFSEYKNLTLLYAMRDDTERINISSTLIL